MAQRAKDKAKRDAEVAAERARLAEKERRSLMKKGQSSERLYADRERRSKAVDHQLTTMQECHRRSRQHDKAVDDKRRLDKGLQKLSDGKAAHDEEERAQMIHLKEERRQFHESMRRRSVELVLLEQRNQLKLESWQADEAAIEAQLISVVAAQAKERAKAAEEELANLKIIGTLGVHV